MVMTGYQLHPSEAIRRLRAEFPDFLICELSGESGNPCFTATSTRASTNGRPELIVTANPDELRRALTVLDSGKTESAEERSQ